MKKLLRTLQRGYLARRAVTVFLFYSGVAFVVSETVTPCAAGLTEVREQALTRTLTLPERITYQYAIEEVYWRHRIWPKDNPQPKPPLDAFVSQHEIENKVSDYLSKSEVIADQRGIPITASELQAEMNRMAAHTKQPDMLRELFAALDNDPFVIAECLARPILVERFVNTLRLHTNETDGSPNRPLPSAGDSARWAITPYQTPYTLPDISADCVDDVWNTTSAVNAPSGRRYYTMVWTGSEMIVWGGWANGRLNTGGRYNPATDSWVATSLNNAPSPRADHTAVWTGNEMIVWGGESNGNPREVDTGGRYNPITDGWTTTSTTMVPPACAQPTAVWTGTEMVIWGGRTDTGWLNTGGRYDPTTDSWRPTATINAPERRWAHTAEWTGTEMIVWGGSNQTILLNTGGKYNPVTDSWAPTSTASAPLGRAAHTSIWSGSEMIVWGGGDSDLNDLDTGGRYNPTTDSWLATNLNNAPSRRDSHTAVWTGDEMIVWGGVWLISPPIDFNTGGRYDPSTDSWTATGTMNVPHARDSHTAVWTGDKMIVWGGGYYIDNSHFTYLNTGGTYCAQASPPLVQSVISRKTHSFAGVYDIALPLNGTAGIECRTGGSTSDYTMVVTFNANVSITGDPQAAVTSGIGTIGTGGVGNGGQIVIADNLVTIPLTNVANAQMIQVTLYGVNSSTNLVIPMSILVGDTNGNGSVNASDVSQIKSRFGQQINATNFRCDVNANGYIDAADVAITKSRAGSGLP